MTTSTAGSTRPNSLTNVAEIETGERVSTIAERTPSPVSRGVNVDTLPEAVDFAKVMCQAEQAIPAAFRRKPGMCLAVTMQALRWGFDPFGVAQNAYVVNDKVAYEAKLMVAAINANAGLAEPLDYQYEGSGDDLFCRVIGHLYRADGEVIQRLYETPPIGSISPKNSPLWQKDPRQQLAYYGARSWARRHAPEVLLGVYGRDEAVDDVGSVINARRPSMRERFNEQPAIAEQAPDGSADPAAETEDERPARDINEDVGTAIRSQADEEGV